MQHIPIGNFNYTKDEKGNWIWKANEVHPLKKEKPVYREKPEYKLQNEIENNSKDRFNKSVKNTVIELVKFLKDIK